MKIRIGRTTYDDTDDKIHKIKRDIECCGKNVRMAARVDSRDFYGYTYHCECGNVITMTIKRSKNDIWY